MKTIGGGGRKIVGYLEMGEILVNVKIIARQEATFLIINNLIMHNGGFGPRNDGEIM